MLKRESCQLCRAMCQGTCLVKAENNQVVSLVIFITGVFCVSCGEGWFLPSGSSQTICPESAFFINYSSLLPYFVFNLTPGLFSLVLFLLGGSVLFGRELRSFRSDFNRENWSIRILTHFLAYSLLYTCARW